MRIIVWGINYSPELTGIAPFNTGLCDYLRERGHDVEVITSFPYYPFWQKVPGDCGRLFRNDDIDGVRVHRCWHYVPRRVTTVRRMCHEFSFGITSFVRAVFVARPDIYVVVSPPLMLGPLAALLCWLKRRPYFFHVQDLQPDAAVGLGMVKAGVLTRLLYRAEKVSYRRAAVVGGISSAMIAAYTRKEVPESKRFFFPNWIRWYGRNTGLLESSEERSARRKRFRLKFHISDGLMLATYSGNLGRKQGLDTLVDAAAILAARTPMPAMLILIIGDGVARLELSAKIDRLRLKNVKMVPLLLESEYHDMLAASDIGLILQAPGTGQYFLPSKLLSVLSMKVPVVAASDADSELAKAVNDGQFGFNVPPGDAEALAKVLAGLADNPERLVEMANRTNWVERYSGGRVLESVENKLLELVRSVHQ